MKFTYEAYKHMLGNLKKHGYQTASYRNWMQMDRCVILRHDIDCDIDKAVRLAEIEKNAWGGVSGTYFVMLTSDFYNVFSKESYEGLRRIAACGHDIGLHFDEARYPELAGNMEEMREKIITEARTLSMALGCRVDTVSMHRPGREMLDEDLQIPGMINSYGKEFFRVFKYLSDSRCRWREPVDEIIESEIYERLHILTHAFWYDGEEAGIYGSVSRFVNSGKQKRYMALKQNFTNLESVMKISDIT